MVDGPDLRSGSKSENFVHVSAVLDRDDALFAPIFMAC